MGVNWIRCVPASSNITSGVIVGEERSPNFFVGADIYWTRREVDQHKRNLSASVDTSRRDWRGREGILLVYTQIDNFYSIVCNIFFLVAASKDVGIEMNAVKTKSGHQDARQNHKS
jgi:hypothetical protein